VIAPVYGRARLDSAFEDPNMDKTCIEAIGHQVKGALKEGFGKVIGDAKLRADCAAQAVRSVKDTK
jgi:uncharacterized protein YjbJ (UPF0337 family)